MDFPGPRDLPVVKRAFPSVGTLQLADPIERRPQATASLGNEMADLIRCLSGAQANDSGWPVFKGKYVEYLQFRKEWWAYRTHHGHIRDELVS